MSKHRAKFFVFLCVSLLDIQKTIQHEITKRSLLFPRATQLQVTTGLSVPFILPKRSINFSLCVQVNYNLPFNITNFNIKTIQARDKPSFGWDVTREGFYRKFIEVLDSFGLNGEQCLLRSICEIAEFPMHTQLPRQSLLEKLVHFVFTPSLELQWKNSTIVFGDRLLLAERWGEEDGDCGGRYAGCLVSIVDLFTAKYVF